MSSTLLLAPQQDLPAPSEHMRRPPLHFLQGWRYWLWPSVALAGFTLYFLLLRSIPEADLVRRQLISEAGQLSALALALSFAFWASTYAPPGRIRWAWRLMAGGLLTYFIAEAIFGYESIVVFAGMATPTPTVADAFYLPFYAVTATGLLLLPGPSVSTSSRLRVLADAGITSGALFGLGLIYIIAPYFQGYTPPVTQAVLVAYPVGDSILILTLVLLLIRGVQANFRPILLLLIAGLCSFIFADFSFDYLGLQNAYVVGAINVDPFWALGEILIGLAPLHFLIYGERTPSVESWLERLFPARQISPLGRSLRNILPPYVSVLVLIALVYLRQPRIPAGSVYLALEVLTAGVILLIIVRQVLLGRDLVDAQEATRRALQLDELKNQFISNVNHELRTPLMTLQAYIELLRARQGTMEPRQRGLMIEEAGRTNDALVELVQSILEVRRLDLESGDFPRESVPLHAAIERATALVNPRDIQQVERILYLSLPADIAVLGERVRVQQILTNLLTNAVKYSEPGSEIEVTARVLPATRGGRGRRGDVPMVEIIVQDHGFGIPPDQAPLLFNRFVRLPRDLTSNVVGSGLGLYLCRTLTEAMGGRIWVESSGVAGEGSTFHVLLPQAPPAAGASTAGASADEGPTVSFEERQTLPLRAIR